MYAVGATTNGIVSVKTMKTVEGIPDPPVTEPEVGNGNVVWLFRQVMTVVLRFILMEWRLPVQRGRMTNQAAGGNKQHCHSREQRQKTAAAYQYNASGIPTGMYV